MADYPDVPRRPVSGPSHLPYLVLILVLLGLLVWRWSAPFATSLHDPDAVPRTVIARGDLAADEKATIELFRKASPSVVYITTLAVRRDIFSLNVLETPQGAGSGFIWDEQGHVVTNYHVIRGADAAQVMLEDRSTSYAQVVGVAADKDIAVLKIDAGAARLRPIGVGASKDLQVGQKVFAIGNPFGLDQTLTTGIISGLGREILSTTRRTIQGVIQTDAAINPGNSGGPLLDSAGLLVGVNTAIYSPSGTYAGVGFAVPADTVNRIVPQLIRHGRVVRPGLGAEIAEDQLTGRLGLKGVLVINVRQGSAAAEAGMQPTRYDATGRVLLGDLIVAIDDRKVESTDDLFTALESYQIGDRVTVTVQRNGRRIELPITLQEAQ
ncbi:MAG: trypsin-like peptidase domain-containing protein [Pirellulales bacterium]